MNTGKVYRIPCTGLHGTFFCKTMPWKIDNFYYFPSGYNLNEIIFGELDFFYANWVHIGVYKSFEFIRKEPISDKERNSIPTFFRQSFFNMNNCNLIIPGQPDPIPCRPEDCIGLERAGVFDDLESLCEKLTSKITGIPTRDHEIMRLRLPGIDNLIDFSGKI